MQPDSIIPNPANPQAFNRFSYVGNNPIRFNDPTGHCRIDDDADECFRPGFNNPASLADYGVTLDPRMKYRERRAILEAVVRVGDAFAEERGLGESGAEAFTAEYDPISFLKTDKFTYLDENGKPYDVTVGCVTGVNTITCADFTFGQFQSDVNNIVHELGHVFNNLHGGYPADFGWDYAADRSKILLPFDGVYWQQNTLYDVNSPDATGGEMFGDMFVAWVFNAWNTNPKLNPDSDVAIDASNDMTTNMSEWLK